MLRSIAPDTHDLYIDPTKSFTIIVHIYTPVLPASSLPPTVSYRLINLGQRSWNAPDPPVIIVPGFEECIIQGHRLDAFHIHILQQIGIEVEKHRHIHGLTSSQALLLETEALNLAKVWRNLGGRDAVSRDADDILVGVVSRCVEGQRRLAGQHAHLALLRDKFPRQHVGDGRGKGHADALSVPDGFETGGKVFGRRR